jgi:GTP-binding protein
MATEFLGYIVADVPGLIKGAHKGIGLGHSFLRHIERCKMIVHLLDIAQTEERDFIQDYRDIREELEFYKGELLSKPELVVANKSDLLTADELKERMSEFTRATGKVIIPLSAATGSGVEDLKKSIWSVIGNSESFLKRMKTEENLPLPAVEPIVYTAPNPENFQVVKDHMGRYVVSGPAVDFYLRKIRAHKFRDRFIMDKLEVGGLTLKLKQAGIEEGDTVVIDEREYVFRE